MHPNNLSLGLIQNTKWFTFTCTKCFHNMLNYGHWPNIFVCKHATLGASIHLFYLSTWSSFAKYAQTRGMCPTDNQKKILFVVSCRLSKSLQWTIHQQESTPKNVATFSSKYNSPMEARNPILQGISCHHQKRRRSSKHWKANVHISNHTCLKQNKTKIKIQNLPQLSHNKTHDTQGLMTNQTQFSWHPKHTEPTFAS